MRNKYVLFSKKVHEALIEADYHTVKTISTTEKEQTRSIKRLRLKGYILETNRYKNPDEKGNWVFKYDDTDIWQYHWYSLDPEDPETNEFYRQYPFQKPRDVTGLTGKAKRKAEIHNSIRHGSVRIASPDISITTVDVEYPLTIDKVKEMYEGTAKFYIRLDVGYNKPGFRKTKFRLYKKLITGSNKPIRILKKH